MSSMFGPAPGSKTFVSPIVEQTAFALDRTGALLIETGLGTIRDSAPVSFHEIGGVRVPVESRYVLEAERRWRQHL